MPKREPMWAFIMLAVLVYVLPVALILVGVIPFSQRFTVLLLMAIAVFALERLRGRTWAELGIRTDNLRGALTANLILSVVLTVGLLVAFFMGAIRTPTIHGWSSFYLFYVLISSPSQEFLFRSTVFAEMERSGLHGRFAQVGVSTVLYALPHAIYHDALTLFVAAVMGVVWGVIYRRYPNWFGVALSHAILGALSIYLGLI